MDLEKIIQAVCRTLIHSLWQGLLLAVFAGLVMLITKKSRSGVRYHLLTALFFLFLVISGYTFSRELNAEANEPAGNSAATIGSVSLHAIALNHNIATDQLAVRALLLRAASFADAHAAYIVGAWLL